MPIYEYACEQCQKIQEVLQKVDDAPPTECPNCHAKKSLKKTVSHSAFQLKGGGWYKDLYSSPKKEDNKKADTKKTT